MLPTNTKIDIFNIFTSFKFRRQYLGVVDQLGLEDPHHFSKWLGNWCWSQCGFLQRVAWCLASMVSGFQEQPSLDCWRVKSRSCCYIFFSFLMPMELYYWLSFTSVVFYCLSIYRFTGRQRRMLNNFWSEVVCGSFKTWHKIT